MENKKGREKGITLVALIITIIVMLILAGVSISILTGDNGLFGKVQRASGEYEKSAQNEAEILAELSNVLGDYLAGIPEKPNLEARKTDGSWNSEENVNSPKLTAGMTPIYFSSNGTPVKLTAASSDEEWDKWYDYTAQTGTTATAGSGTSHWANAQTKDGSYWVWVPRYAYQIKSGLHYSNQGEIDVVFIDVYNKDHKNVAKTYSETYPTTTMSGTAAGMMNDFVVHPAFKWGNKNLPGIWVAKFEASMSDAGITRNDMGNSNVIKIQPNVTSWGHISISDIFTNCRNMNVSQNPYGFTTKEKPHMMKNIEWGAVAYLAHSKYGRNRTEITINNSSDYITGSAGSTVSAEQNVGTEKWTTALGQLASTTGNLYGIYDISGGTREYTATFVNDDYIPSTHTESLFIELSNNSNTPYIDIYSAKADTAAENYEANSAKFGDAVYEISSNGAGGSSWNADDSQFSEVTWYFIRGGSYSQSTNAGAFCFDDDSGRPSADHSFHPVCFCSENL